jgi:hypothetical protein
VLAVALAAGVSAEAGARTAKTPPCAISAARMAALIGRSVNRVSLDTSTSTIHACYYSQGKTLRALVLISKETRKVFDSVRKLTLADRRARVVTPVSGLGAGSYFYCYASGSPECQLAVRRGPTSTIVNLSPPSASRSLDRRELAVARAILKLVPRIVPAGKPRETVNPD